MWKTSFTYILVDELEKLETQTDLMYTDLLLVVDLERSEEAEKCHGLFTPVRRLLLLTRAAAPNSNTHNARHKFNAWKTTMM